MVESQGIILRKFFPTKRMIAMLDVEHGKILLVPDTEQVCVGALVRYYTNTRLSTRFIHNIEHLAVPFELARHDLLFYHHVLELCYYFVPRDSMAPDVFYFVRQLCLLDKEYFSYRFKIIFLVRLFPMLGVQPEILPGRWPLLVQMFATGIDSVVIANIDLELIREMHEWLHSCVSHHSSLAQFKTLQFLKESEMEII